MKRISMIGANTGYFTVLFILEILYFLNSKSLFPIESFGKAKGEL